MNRLGILVVYDRDNIIDRYVLYLAKELQKILNRFIIVYNGNLPDDEYRKLLECSNEVYQRQNIGLDAGAYKDILCNAIRLDEIHNYDELVLCNDTFYGPFVPFNTIFDKMQNRDMDFWGLTKHFANGCVAEHIQSYFLVIRNRLLHSEDFSNFWKEIKYQFEYSKAIETFEVEFTKLFSQKGYSYATYVDLESYRDEEKYNYNYLINRSYKVINELNCPILKKKALTAQSIYSYDIKRVIEYLRINTDYDTSMIWENALRIYNITDLNNSIHMHYIVDDICRQQEKSITKLAVVACLFEEENITECVKYLNGITDNADIFIGAFSRKVYDELMATKSLFECEIINCDNGLDMFHFLFSDLNDKLKSYDYIAFLNDQKIYKERCASLTDDAILTNKWDNLLKDGDYVNKVENLFENNPELGILSPVSNVELFPEMSCQISWDRLYPYVKDFLCRLNISVPISEDIEPYIFTETFWARKEALTPLWMHYDETALEFKNYGLASLEMIIGYLLPYIAQSKGYTSAKIENSDYASMMHDVLLKRYDETIKKRERIMVDFCRNYQKIYIYGAGKLADKVYNLLKMYGIDFEAFIVSNPSKLHEEKYGHPIIALDESDYLSKDTCYITALNSKNKAEVLPILRSKGIVNIFNYDMIDK